MVASVARDWLPLKDPAMAQLRTVKTTVELWKAKEKKEHTFVRELRRTAQGR
jgi:hypothetical protein